MTPTNEILAMKKRWQPPFNPAISAARYMHYAVVDIPKLLLDREELQAEVERLKPLPPVDPRKPISVKDKYEPMQFHTLKEKDFIDGKLTDLKDFEWLVKELIKERNSMAETAWNSNVGYIKARQELDSLRRDKERLFLELQKHWIDEECYCVSRNEGGSNEPCAFCTTGVLLKQLGWSGDLTALRAAIAQERKGEK